MKIKRSIVIAKFHTVSDLMFLVATIGSVLLFKITSEYSLFTQLILWNILLIIPVYITCPHYRAKVISFIDDRTIIVEIYKFPFHFGATLFILNYNEISQDINQSKGITLQEALINNMVYIKQRYSGRLSILRKTEILSGYVTL